jgi:hypothetical protein
MSSSEKTVPKRSNGSKLGAISGMIIVVAFFLPWVRACSQDLSGYDIAANSDGLVETPWVYWLTLLAGSVCLALFLLVGTERSRARIGAAIVRLVAGLAGFLPLLNAWYDVRNSAALQVLYGGWIVISGYAGIALSFVVDLLAPSKKTD